MARFCGTANLATLDETSTTPGLLTTVTVMLALHREVRRNSKQRLNLFQAAEKTPLQINTAASFSVMAILIFCGRSKAQLSHIC